MLAKCFFFKQKNLSLLPFCYFFLPPPPPPPCYYYDYYCYYYCMQRLKESCKNHVIFLASVPGLPCAQKWKRKKGKKQEINSSEANIIPNSQYNINFGWWLAFISFCLDEQIYCKRNIWVVTASSASEIRVIVLDKNNNFLFFLIIHLLNFL